MWNSLLPALYPISVHPLSTLSIFPSLSHPASYPASNQPPIHLPIHPHLGPCPACHPFSIHPPKGQCPKPSLHFATPPSALFSFLSFIGPATHTCLELSLSAPCSPLCTWSCPCSINASAPRRAPQCPPPSQPQSGAQGPLLVHHLIRSCLPEFILGGGGSSATLGESTVGWPLGDTTNFNNGLRKKMLLSLFPPSFGEECVCT